MRIVLSGGGTGGHVTPILTCAKALKEQAPTAELIYIGDAAAAAEPWLKQSGMRLTIIPSGKFRRYPGQAWWQTFFDLKTHLQNLVDIFKIIGGLWQSLRILMKLKPDVVFVKGGFVGLPVGVAAWLLGKPLIIHESDVVPGLTNRLLARLAKTVAVSWPEVNFRQWQGRHLVFTGNPIRSELTSISKNRGQTFFKLKVGTPTLLIMGGSGGSSVINQAVTQNLKELLSSFQVIHIGGRRDYPELKKQLASLSAGEKAHYRLFDFLPNDLGYAYAASDIVVARAGMNTISELAALAKPAIIIPFPYATGAHQQRNAELLEKHQAAVVLDQSQLPSKFLDTINELWQSTQHRQLLQKGLAKFAKPAAAQLLAKEILKLT